MNAKQLLDIIIDNFEEHAEEKLTTEELRMNILDTVRDYLDEIRELVVSMQQILDKAHGN